MEYLVSEEFQQPEPPVYDSDSSSLMNTAFPVRKEMLEKGLQDNVDYAAGPDAKISLHTNRYTGEKKECYEGTTEEDKQAILHMIDNAYRLGGFDRDYNLLAILIEDTDPFFQGQKTAEEAAEIIQSRVSLYLAE